MKVAITGASGLLGQAISRSLQADGHDVKRVVRRPTDRPDELFWQPSDQTIDEAGLVGVDAVVHLAGEPLFGLRWTDAKKDRILQSRTLGTSLIARTLAEMDGGPKTLISASAVGYYGHCDGWVDEDAPGGTGFLAEVCIAWEEAAQPARDAGIRVVHPRFGLVLAPEGGVLGPMLPPFKLGVGGPVGDGSQYFSWVLLEDAVAAVRFALDGDISGPMNVVAPNPVTNAEFTRALGAALHRPVGIRLPRFAVRATMGEMGEELLLQGQRVRPARLLKAGYEFECSLLDDAFARVLG